MNKIEGVNSDTMSRKPRVSIIVLNYNSKEHLETCFRSLENQTYDNYEIVMVDNCSSDDSINFVKEKFSQVKIITLDKNYGYTGGNNKAVEHVYSKYVAFINPDVKLDQNWLKELMDVMQKNEEVKAVGGKIFSFENELLSTTSFIGAVGSFRCEKSMSDPNKPQFTGAVSGSAMLVEKAAFLKIGGFDSDYFMYGDETDLCWRFWLYGYKVMYVPKAIAYHKGGGSSEGRNVPKSPFFIKQRTKNVMASIIKNFELPSMIMGVAIWMVYNFFIIIQNIVKGNWNVIKAILKGYLNFFMNFKSHLKKRKFIQKQRVISDSELMDLGILLSLRESFKLYRERLKSSTKLPFRRDHL